MRKLLNALSIASSVAVILSLCTDMFFRVNGARQKDKESSSIVEDDTI